MKTLLAAAAVAALAATPLAAAPFVPPPHLIPVADTTAAPPWVQDDGSSSDHPIHNPGDVSGERLNRDYSGGLIVPPGQGFPAEPRLR